MAVGSLGGLSIQDLSSKYSDASIAKNFDTLWNEDKTGALARAYADQNVPWYQRNQMQIKDQYFGGDANKRNMWTNTYSGGGYQNGVAMQNAQAIRDRFGGPLDRATQLQLEAANPQWREKGFGYDAANPNAGQVTNTTGQQATFTGQQQQDMQNIAANQASGGRGPAATPGVPQTGGGPSNYSSIGQGGINYPAAQPGQGGQQGGYGNPNNLNREGGSQSGSNQGGMGGYGFSGQGGLGQGMQGGGGQSGGMGGTNMPPQGGYMGQGGNAQWAQPAQNVGGFNTPGYQYGMPNAGDIQKTTMDNSGQYNTQGIDPARMPVDQMNQGQRYVQEAQDAYYNQAKSRLDPQWQQRQGDLENQLANMGLARGTEAWNRELSNMSTQRNDAYNTAQNQAIMNSGQEGARMQGMDINAGNFMNQAAQQNFQNQGTAQQWQNAALAGQQQANMAAGNFQNAAQQQQYAQNMGAANLNNQALTAQQQNQLGWGSLENQRLGLDQNFSLGQGNLALQGRGMENSERLQDFNMGNAMRMQPIYEQNALMQGMYPTGMPGFGSLPQASPYGAGYTQAPYSTMYNQAQGTQNAGYGAAVGAMGGLAQGAYNQYQLGQQNQGPQQLGIGYPVGGGAYG